MKIETLKELRKQIKQSMDRDKVKAILEYLGYEVDRNYTFKLREERTPSASIRRDGYIKDFGSGWGGDIVALIHEYHAIARGYQVGSPVPWHL